MSDYSLSNFFLSTSKFLFNLGFIVLPSAGYMAQYLKIKKLKNSEGFSKLIAFSLIMAFIIRIYFWVGKKFEITLLLQSIYGIFIQLILLHLCIKFTKKPTDDTNIINIKEGENFIEESEENLDFLTLRNFWNWNFFADYLNFLFFFSIIMGLFTNFFKENTFIYFELIGCMSAIFEALTGIPQIIENFRYKNTKTLSNFLIFTWVCGDTIKFVYFIVINAPIQLIACAFTQCLEDFFIIFQIFLYRKNN